MRERLYQVVCSKAKEAKFDMSGYTAELTLALRHLSKELCGKILAESPEGDNIYFCHDPAIEGLEISWSEEIENKEFFFELDVKKAWFNIQHWCTQ